ncbi:MAG TPA: M20/M25/M40 family metallo-hydrolase [Bacteroidales bacterium]|nr:M20/M25/M40 family metallo-hydrolase [Bacteroidales bacterium]
MKNIQRVLVILLAFLPFLPLVVKAQIAYSPVIDSLIYQATPVTVSLAVRQLSGDTTVIIDGTPQTITTRSYQYNSIQNKAAQFIKEQFESFGLQARYMDYSASGRNIIARKPGTRYPDKEFIICAHMDDMPTNAIAPGADDNASGVVAVLEAARILAPLPSEYTLVFAAWDEEEIGLVGSKAYADSAIAGNEQIMGVLNYDMIAWDSNNDYILTIGTNLQSQELTNSYQDVMKIYTPEFSWTCTSIEASDHSPFWHKNYPAILVIEHYPDDFNQYYHSQQDNFSNLNVTYFTRMVQAAVAGLASLGWDCRLYFEHQPVVSGIGNSAREAILSVYSFRPIAEGEHQPRLYYKVNDGEFQYITATTVTGNQYTFEIPGQADGSMVTYYFAVQDSAAVMMGTYPDGGRGISPPGTQPPANFFTYYVGNAVTEEFCSPSASKPIPDLGTVRDTISIEVNGGIKDVDVSVNITHDFDKTLNIRLTSPAGTSIDLSSGNGDNGADFTGTIFDDEAAVSIISGVAPFTGRFRPEQPLSTLDNGLSSGDWILSVTDSIVSHTGTLDSWCITLEYYDLAVDVPEALQKQSFTLGQNFPNPADQQTTIPFSLEKEAKVNLGIYDLFGRRISTLTEGLYQRGTHFINGNLSQLKPGTYFCRLQCGAVSQTKALVVVR